MVSVVSDIRTVRGETGVPPGARLKLLVKDAGSITVARIETHRSTLERLARLEQVALLEGEVPAGSIQTVVAEATLVLPVGELVDLAAERSRLAREIEKLDSEAAKITAKLANENFVSKAKPEVVQDQRERKEALAETRRRLNAALARLA